MMSYTPFDCLVVAEQTLAGLLVKDPPDSEVELVQVSQAVELRSANTEPMIPIQAASGQVDHTLAQQGQWIDRCGGLTLTVTTHRLVFWQRGVSPTTTRPKALTGLETTAAGPQEARFVHGSLIMQMAAETQYFKSPKILLNTTAFGDLYLVFAKDQTKVRDEVYQIMSKAYRQRKQWEVDQQHEVQRNMVHHLTSRRVGLDAILTKSAMKHQQAAKLTKDAFEGDLETLLGEATALVRIIQRYVATLDRSSQPPPSSSAPSDKDPDKEDSARLVAMLRDMGMTSALSKADYLGREDAYYDQLARQLADFFRPKIIMSSSSSSANNPGVLTLTDVYCLFNRARGTNLIAPDDLLKAVQRMKDLHLGMSYFAFPKNGLKVLLDDRMADPAEFLRRLQQQQPSAGTSESWTALDVCRLLHVPAVLASEQLQFAEQAGYLVRDETLESLRFYLNRFDEWTTSSKAAPVR